MVLSLDTNGFISSTYVHKTQEGKLTFAFVCITANIKMCLNLRRALGSWQARPTKLTGLLPARERGSKKKGKITENI